VKAAFGDYYGQRIAIVKSREHGFWQSISSPDPRRGTYRLFRVAVRLPFPRPATMAEKAMLLQIQKNPAGAN
jgi:hypothetical protein